MCWVGQVFGQIGQDSPISSRMIYSALFIQMASLHLLWSLHSTEIRRGEGAQVCSEGKCLNNPNSKLLLKPALWISAGLAYQGGDKNLNP